MENTAFTTTEHLVRRNEKSSKSYLKWLTGVYPRFAKYYETLGPLSPNVTNPDWEEYTFPAEMFCEVNIPKIVSPSLL